MNKTPKINVPYGGMQNMILKYMSMRVRMGKPLVSIEQIMAFNPEKVKKKDKLKAMLKTMVKNSFIQEKDGYYTITNAGKHVPFIVANEHQKLLTKSGKRTLMALDDWTK